MWRTDQYKIKIQRVLKLLSIIALCKEYGIQQMLPNTHYIPSFNGEKSMVIFPGPSTF